MITNTLDCMITKMKKSRKEEKTHQADKKTGGITMYKENEERDHHQKNYKSVITTKDKDTNPLQVQDHQEVTIQK